MSNNMLFWDKCHVLKNKSNNMLFWDKCHVLKNKSHLSNCGYLETIEFLQVDHLIKPGLNVLEVGIGLGNVLAGLKAAGVNVYALDISIIALERFAHLCKGTYHTTELGDLPSNFFDIIICHNVVQHITTPILIVELEHLIRSLKGTFSFEFVSDDVNEDSWNESYKYKGDLPTFCRTPNFMMSILKRLGVKGELVVDNKCNFKTVKGCHVIKVVK